VKQILSIICSVSTDEKIYTLSRFRLDNIDIPSRYQLDNLDLLGKY
jgi:ABC-type antimicrobial peptide transport system ATPase subunit